MKCILPTPLVRLVDDDNDFRESQKAFLTLQVVKRSLKAQKRSRHFS